MRGVSRLEERIKKAENLGFQSVVLPAGGALYRGKKIKVIEVGHISQLGELLAKN